MQDKIEELLTVHKNFEQIGKDLFFACENSLFPADAIFLSGCDKALKTIDSFILLFQENHYTNSAALLRLQLDIVIRLYGITKTKDIHAAANKVLQGEKFSKIKDNNGQYLKDWYMVKLISKDNPWINRVYDLCSSYIHFSGSAFFHLTLQSKTIPESNERLFYSGSNETNIENKHKLELIDAFITASKGIQQLTTHWIENRTKFGKKEELEKTYKNPL